MRRAAVLLLVVAVSGACGDDEPTSASTGSGTATAPAGMACLEPRDPQTRPEGGWLADDGSVVDGLPAELPVIDASEGLDALHAELEDALSKDFVVDTVQETQSDDGCAIRRVVIARRADGARVFVDVEQLRGRRSMLSIPLSGGLQHDTAADGSELVTDDFDGDGVRRTVLFATPDGLLVEVIATGADAPDLSGWPTTMATQPGAQQPAGPSPLSMAEIERLARDVAARQAG